METEPIMNPDYTLAQLPETLASMQAELDELRRRVDMLEGQVPDLVSTEEAAELLGLHANTVKKMIRSGRLPATKPGAGRNWKIARADVLSQLIEGPS